jgi:hypothetical protein
MDDISHKLQCKIYVFEVLLLLLFLKEQLDGYGRVIVLEVLQQVVLHIPNRI